MTRGGRARGPAVPDRPASEDRGRGAEGGGRVRGGWAERCVADSDIMVGPVEETPGLPSCMQRFMADLWVDIA